jgi:urease accessory protein
VVQHNEHRFEGAPPITLQSVIPAWSATTQPPRALGRVDLSTKNTARRTALSDLYQSGALKMLFPRCNNDPLQGIIINTAGGVTGGDAFSFSAHVAKDTHLGLTTQAAERAYRAQPDQIASIRNRLVVARGARADWLPQETILYEACALDRRLSVELETGASLLMVEPIVFGRTAMGEVLRDAHFRDRIEIHRDGTPLYLDAITLKGDVTGHFARSEIGQGARAMATIVLVSDTARSVLEPVRSMLPTSAGASLIGHDLLVVRILAPDSFVLRQSLVPVLGLLNNNTLPRSWMT